MVSKELRESKASVVYLQFLSCLSAINVDLLNGSRVKEYRYEVKIKCSSLAFKKNKKKKYK